jgi:nucleotide-binding universal stress UspA family protein
LAKAVWLRDEAGWIVNQENHIMKARRTKKPGRVALEIGPSDERMLAEAISPRRVTHSSFAINRILVPVDFSDCSRKALRYAIPLAKEHAAAITLLYVVPKQYTTYDYGGPNMPSFEAHLFVNAEKRLHDLLEEEVRAQVPADAIVRDGSAVEDILEAAEKLPADLIVISTHGHTGFKHILLGSVTEQVVRRAPCPVLVVREKENEFLVG